MIEKYKKILHSWFNKYELQYRVLMLIAVVYLLIAHISGF